MCRRYYNLSALIGETTIEIAKMIRDGKIEEVEPIMSIPVELIIPENVDKFVP